MTEESKLPGWALPDLDFKVLDQEWDKAVAAHPEGVAGHVRDLIEEAQKEFDSKWGIHPDSPTDWGEDMLPTK